MVAVENYEENSVRWTDPLGGPAKGAAGHCGSRDTLWRRERGDATVSVGTLATAAFVLQLHDRLADLAAPASDAPALSLDERRLAKCIRRPRA